MRRLICSMLLIAGASAVASAATFEGAVDYELKDSKGRTTPIQYEIKSPRLRMNMKNDGKAASMIFDAPKNTMWVLVPDQKMAMKNTLPNPAEQKKAAADKKVDFQKTGRKETIAGRECTVYTYQSEDGSGEMCNAEGMGAFHFSGGRQQKGGSDGWADLAKEKGLFPLRMLNKDAKGKTTTMIATKIEKKSFPASHFQVPSDYQVMEGWGGAGGSKGGSAAGAPERPSVGGMFKKALKDQVRDRTVGEVQNKVGR